MRLLSVRPLLRGLVALLAVVGVVLGVSACEVKPGAAAFVGNEKITESDVAGYVSTETTASPSTDGQSLTPRAQVVATFVGIALFRQYLQANGGVPSDATLLASRQQAFTVVTGQAFPDIDQFRSTLESLGFDGDFADLYATLIELEYQVIERSKATSLAELATAVSAVTDTPRISPRYGTWDPQQLSLSGSSSTPDYLQLAGAGAGSTPVS